MVGGQIYRVRPLLGCCQTQPHNSGIAGARMGLIHAGPLWTVNFINTNGLQLWRVCCGVQVALLLYNAPGSLLEKWYAHKPLSLSIVSIGFIYAASRVVAFSLIFISF